VVIQPVVIYERPGRHRTTQTVYRQRQDLLSYAVKQISNGVERGVDGTTTVPSCKGEFLTQSLQLCQTRSISLLIPRQKKTYSKAEENGPHQRDTSICGVECGYYCLAERRMEWQRNHCIIHLQLVEHSGNTTERKA